MAGAEALAVSELQQHTPHALVFLAHGSRDPLWRGPVEAIAERVRQIDPNCLVRCAYLELTEPDLASCVAELAKLGVDAVTVVPLFLGLGKHAREDIPQITGTMRDRYPMIAFTLRPAIGEDARFVDMIAQMSLLHA
jgi:sirohydrochlorin cobaltochelatase